MSLSGIRQVTYRIDAFLPEGSQFLFLSMEIVNTRDEEVPIYWWSNIAVEETPQTRVIVPAAKAFHWGYEGVLDKQSVPVTESEKVDLSYSMNASYSLDLFFDIGTAPASLHRCAGRKGRRPYPMLHPAAHRAQAVHVGYGLRRQPLAGASLRPWPPGIWRSRQASPIPSWSAFPCRPAHAGAGWRPMAPWTPIPPSSMEMITLRPGSWWMKSFRPGCDERLDQLLEALSSESPKGLAPKTMGSGWAALEERRRGASLNDELSFEGSMTDEQAPWLSLLERGVFPCPDTKLIPCDWQTQAEWLSLLEKARPGSNHWYTHLHLGML